MKFKGILLKESLKDESVLEILEIVKTETWNVKNTADYQPDVWTAVYFEGEAGKADETAERLSGALKSRWYINFSVNNKVYMMFPERVFKYKKGDKKEREKIKDYARSLNIPESQLDWTE
jgi:hypothetical protein